MGAIEFKQVKKTFKDGAHTIEALKKTDFAVEKGEFVAIIGPSGSGKSTFLTIAGGLQAPSEGEVLINGNPFSKKKEQERAKLRFKEIGFVLQSSNLVPFLTVQQQLQLVDKISKENRKQTADNLFTQLGIDQLKKKYPEELSGGERQRVAIARALYHDPTIILADEPTASLDTEKAYEVAEILAKETKKNNKATIMVTHDTRLIDYCDRVLIMKDGILKEKI
ncbi:ABC transporter ATP-binding protein [Shouchella clausii]|uniref:Putative hemin import ATP-binding protein HrtA n=2 Tax=Shouchella TaxID=2893057 RepID=A0A268NXY1_SHOCL|nr:ABC transporter ATP-binding protein [Shouchella clausii]KKI86761.1 hemin ABC transporter ATP-binding protein [Shouchella clausii]MBX0320858.1 ABC transporter ATP-binding protein [Shouchella clausii]MDO7269452.1 ABC transporter ATP-binding protein [Shouchella clausii]MDO7284482.1 ABC transporter ATP-binding protein [Shouchella clausii]MDO7289334.1 ABC transporter ATP-binding protein [Shouchella clausii]